MNIPLVDLRRQYQTIKHDVDAAIGRVVGGGIFILGPHVEAFERAFASYIGGRHGVGLGCGTDALTLALRGLGLGPGDEVVIPANAYPTVFGVAQAGVGLRLVDCRGDGTIDPELLAKTLTRKTKAVVVVHLYGKPADLSVIVPILGERGILLIEDAAQAHGAEIKHQASSTKQQAPTKSGKPLGSRDEPSGWRKVGSIGAAGCFSFYPTKNLGAYGDGGMVVTSDTTLAQRIRMLRMYGERERYISEEVSGISRLDEIQAAILTVKLQHLDEWNKKRSEVAAWYMRELSGVGDIRFISKPDKREESRMRPVWYACAIRTSRRDGLGTYLTERGIQSVVHYPITVHLTRAFRSLGYKNGDFPVSESISREVLSLPTYAELTETEVQSVTDAIRSFFKQ